MGPVNKAHGTVPDIEMKMHANVFDVLGACLPIAILTCTESFPNISFGDHNYSKKRRQRIA